ncbi:RNA polymerase I-specific transcription initiation factor RRN3 [Thelohanellus kitauei]|uniref:RNA polymerase I-specific transcription initiation factor RRN3 n=1 Tax=Thelohanellus kitauei TaxID=669202 RepID=A0A0C2IVQ1_THEKT|nr:RNA polymerase I-specific transcription initiation factor RRN3 [Thelohanellus kitauei]
MAHVEAEKIQNDNQSLCKVLEGPKDPILFKQNIDIIRRNVINMEDCCKSLIRTIPNLDWTRFNPEQSSDVLDLMGEIFSAHPITVPTGIEALVKSIKTPDPVQQRFVLRAITKLFCLLVKISPASRKYILESLFANTPYPCRTKSHLLNHYNLLFSMIKKHEKMRPHLCEILIEGLIKLDVELPNEKRLILVKIVQELRDKNIPVQQARKHYAIDGDIDAYVQVADKYDEVLALCFKQMVKLHRTYQREGESFYQVLWSGFSKVLACRGLIAVQFIWFYFSAVDADFCNETLTDLWTRFNDVSELTHMRHSCITFLGGIISRGTFVPYDTLCDFLTSMSGWVHDYVLNNSQDGLECTEVGSTFHPHHLFYVACQNLFYCILFKTNSIKKGSDEARAWSDFVNKLGLEKVFFSSLNPLYFMSRKIVDQIAKVGTDLEIYYIYPLLERNNRLRGLKKSTEKPKANAVYINILDLNNSCNFPFDPCVIPSAKVLIDPTYRTWKK